MENEENIVEFFRYENRKKYEEELKRLVREKKDQQYDALIEEYLRFLEEER